VFSSLGFLTLFAIDWIKLSSFQLKSITIIVAGLLFIVSTPYPLLLKSFEKSHWPNKVIVIMFFVYRLIFILSYELHRMYIAFQSRYIRLSLLKRVRIYVNLLTTYLVRVFDRNEALFKALISRGFNGRVYCSQNLTWTSIDSLILFSGLLFLLFILKVPGGFYF
jgi:cobalt/nickel transport system permease protein